MNIGIKLKQLRTDKGLTLKQLAEITKLSISFISDIENGRRNPSLENLNILASALDVSSETLISESNVPILNDPFKTNHSQSSIDKEYFRIAQDAKKNGIPPEDFAMALEIVRKFKEKKDK